MKRFLILFFSLSCLLTASAQTVADVFRQMPDSLLPYLTTNNRLDFIDFLDSNMKAEVTNAFGGKSEMQRLTADYLLVRLNEVSVVEMRMLDVAEPVDSCSRMVCVVHTYGDGLKESTVQFFSATWRPLPTADYAALPAAPFVAALSDESSSLTLTAVDFNLPATEEQVAEPQKVQEIFNWNGRKFNKY